VSFVLKQWRKLSKNQKLKGVFCDGRHKKTPWKKLIILVFGRKGDN
jgi:hypothetical protein